jgi:raffinose/stachyose/melibiose transport system substrate-binding protein
MKRNLLFVLTTLVLFSLIIVACAPASQTPTPVPVDPEKEEVVVEQPEVSPVNLTMWDIPESEPYTEWWEDHVAEWNKANPAIQVKMEVFETEPYKTKLIGALASNSTADIFYQFAGGDSYRVYKEGKALALDNLMKVDQFTEVGLSKCRVDGKVVCMPLYIAPALWYYNKAMFAQAGVDPQTWANPLQPTWEEFLAACEALKEAGIVPIALGNADAWPGMMIYSAFANRIGGNDPLFNAISGENGGAYTDASFVRAGELVQELNSKGYFPEGYNGIGGEQKYALFTQERGAMIFQGSWMLGYIKSDAPDGFEFGFFNTPSFSEGNPNSQSDVMGGVDALWISANSKNPQQAGEFLNSFVDAEIAKSFASETENISVVKGVMETFSADSVLAQMAQILSSAPSLVPWWDVEMPAPVTEEMMNNMQALFGGEITPQEFSNRLQAASVR